MNGQPLWAEVDLGAIAHNLHQVRRLVGPAVRVMAVVKADGYGHGALAVARTALQNGADWLGVARPEEGIALRQAGIHTPILVFGFAPAPEQLLEFNLTATLYTVDQARCLSALAASRGQPLRAHLKIDTGMGRLGLPTTELVDQSSEQIAAIFRLPFLEIEGIYTHFAAADAHGKGDTRRQISRFQGLLKNCAKRGMCFCLRHAANSAALINLPETRLDMVRAGIMLYGLLPSAEMDTAGLGLLSAMQLKARVAQVKVVPKGFRVSYGGTHVTPRGTRLATVTIGYADGYPRLLSSRGEMLVGGHRAPVVGRICMDQAVLDVGHIDGVKPGDEVVVFGRQGRTALSALEVASRAQTIPYEIVSSLTARVPRTYRSLA